MRSVLTSLILLFVVSAIHSQDAPAPAPPDDPSRLSFMEYDPPSTLVVPGHPVERARYPFVDVHSHQGNLDEEKLAGVVASMDAMNLAALVNLSGRGFRRIETPGGQTRFGLREPEYLREMIALAERLAPGRILHFTNVDFSRVGALGWPSEAVAELEGDIAAGARGLKIYKSLGMDATDVDGRRIPVDDPRLDPIWEACARLGVPVLIHTADPAPFWQARTPENERLYELIEIPGRYRNPDENVPWQQLIDEQHNLFRRHPETVFINAHLGWLGNDLGRLGELLDELPNVHTEIGAVLAELGRQPRFARAWLIRYQDRVMFGKDSYQPEEFPYYFRVLETADDYFPYYRRRHAFWKLYGLDLPDDVLRKLYYGNALRLIPGLDPALFPAAPE
ncbi:MAG TPA: amidohydrolase family protein [Candidatus Limnocylindrales bacterium]|nr:amidohydrolase family protein [Candidatus Limnocylindrales bacterium]